MFDYIKSKVKGRSGGTAADGVSTSAHNNKKSDKSGS